MASFTLIVHTEVRIKDRTGKEVGIMPDVQFITIASKNKNPSVKFLCQQAQLIALAALRRTIAQYASLGGGRAAIQLDASGNARCDLYP